MWEPPLPWALVESGLRPGQAAPTWRAAVDEEGQPCSQAKTGQKGHGSWGRNASQGLPAPRRAGRGSETKRDRLVSSVGRGTPGEHFRGVCPREARNRAQLGVEKSPGRDRALGRGTEGKQQAVTPVTELSARGA